jgi:hypothetical protein
MPYQMTVTLAEERVRDSGKVGRRVSSEAELVRMLQGFLPGWDIDLPTTARGATSEEVISSWRRPGLMVRDYPGLRNHGGSGSDALAAVAPPDGVSDSDGLLMFLYQDIRDMNELIVIHEAAHALTFDFDAGHGERWLDTYLEMLGNAGLREAVNLITFMTGKKEIKFVEGRRRTASRPTKVQIRDKVHFASPTRDFPGRKGSPEPLCGARSTRGQITVPSAVPDDTPVNCQRCIDSRDEMLRQGAHRGGMRKGAPFAGYDDFADCVSKNSDKDDPEAYCGAIKSKTEGARRSRTSQYRSIR